MSVKSIKIETIAQRAALLAAGFVFLISVVFFVRWCFGYAIATQIINKELAEFAIDLAPNAPQTHFALAALHEQTFLPEDLQKSLAGYEKATALAPHDYRRWFALGKARERNGDAAGAESALKKAVELAPNYSRLRWAYGNVILRQGRLGEGFAEMRRAAEGDKTFINPLVTTAWQIFDGDITQIKQNVGDSVQINFVLPTFLAGQNRYDEAFAVWSSLPAEAKKTTFKENAEDFFKKLVEAKKYRDALRVKTETRESGAENFAVGLIFNGGFETDIKQNADVFGWQIAEGVQPQIGFDVAQKKGGNQSLVIVFNSPNGQDFRSLSQIVVVESGKSYGFEGQVKSNLKTAATLKWEIVDVSEGKVLATTEAVAAVADWTSLRADFTVPENTQAVTIRLARDVCKTPACPISGKIWFDDFNLTVR